MEGFENEWKGREAELKHILQKTVSRNVEAIENLEGAISSSNSEQIKFIAHKLKFIAKYFRLENLRMKIDAIELAFEEDQQNEVLSLGPDLLDALRSSQAQLISIIEK